MPRGGPASRTSARPLRPASPRSAQSKLLESIWGLLGSVEAHLGLFGLEGSPLEGSYRLSFLVNRKLWSTPKVWTPEQGRKI